MDPNLSSNANPNPNPNSLPQSRTATPNSYMQSIAPYPALHIQQPPEGYLQQQGELSFQSQQGQDEGGGSSKRNPKTKSYRCSYPGCEKLFSRAEHLNRHATNHDNGGKGTWFCSRCGTVFKRKDLLERHNIRHRQKDEEAGGEGLGLLQTRKRLWKDDSGETIEGPRPEHAKRHRSSASRSSISDHQDGYSSCIPNQIPNQPISPPGSRASNSNSVGYFGQQHDYQIQEAGQNGMWTAEQQMQQAPLGHGLSQPEDHDFLINAAWGSDLQEPAIDPMLYNEVFAPDTASSFNNPFTTESYYCWLFDDQNAQSFNFDPTLSNAPNGSISSAQQSTTPCSSSANMSTSDLTSQGYHQSPPTTGQFSSPQRLQVSALDAQSPELSAANQILALSQGAQNVIATSLGYADSPKPEQNVLDWSSSADLPRQGVNNNQALPKAPIPTKLRQLPFVDEAARQGILDFVDKAVFPQGSNISREHPLLSLGALQAFCSLYFTRFNTSYPLLHQATFDPARVDPLLLLAVVLLGATYSNKEAHLFSICVHDTMRAQIMNHTNFTPRPALWMLQTILLVECFGKSRAGQLQHDMSHLFHGLLINLIRRSDCQSARCLSDESRTNNEQWLAEVDAEQRRRLALLCFMWDTQHAVLFSQSLCMNAAELKLTLPWNDHLWEADTAEEFFALAEKPQPNYLSALKTYMSPSQQAPISSLNPLSQILMLHGLMSVAWDLNRRDQTSMSLSIPTKDPWQTLLARAYNNWYDTFRSSPVTPTSTPTTTAATLAIYHAAHIALHVEITDLQIFAGAQHIIGRPVTTLDISRSMNRIQAWVAGPHAVGVFLHAARILRDGMQKLHDWDAGDVFHYPWCLYLATLTLWSFQVCCKAELRSSNHPVQENEMERDEFDAKAEMMALVSQVTRSGLGEEEMRELVTKFRALDVPRIMAGVLGRVRWAVVQEGLFVLRGLGRVDVAGSGAGAGR